MSLLRSLILTTSCDISTANQITDDKFLQQHSCEIYVARCK